MASTFFGLTISYTGLQAASTSLNVVGHNVSNIKTKGYSRQYADTTAADALRTYSTYGSLGAGVVVSDIAQYRNHYYDDKYRSNQANYGHYEAKDSYMTQIEDFLDEWNLDGYSYEYTKFFEKVEEVEKTPGEASAKDSLVNSALSLSQYFNTLSANLSKIQEDANNELNDAVEQINSYAKNIASLNRQINQIEANYGNANDLRDKRNALVDELSEIVNVTTDERSIGNGLTEYQVFINGQTLVDNYDFSTLYTSAREDKRNASDVSGLYDIYWNYGQKFNLYSKSLGGQMGALVQIRDGCNDGYEVYATEKNADGSVQTDANGDPVYKLDEYGNKYLEFTSDVSYNTTFKGIPYYQEQLNQFIYTFTKSVNDILKEGYSSDGKYKGEDYPLFVLKENTDTMTASNVTVNYDIIKDVTKLATRQYLSTGESESDIMKKLAAFKSEKAFDGGTGAYFLESIVSDMSIDKNNTSNMLSNYTNLKTTIGNQRLSVMGVDTDEEAMDLTMYQQAYNLNSKLMTVMNQIYDKLINQTGV